MSSSGVLVPVPVGCVLHQHHEVISTNVVGFVVVTQEPEDDDSQFMMTISGWNFSKTGSEIAKITR